MKSAQRTAIDFLRGRWPGGVPIEAIERAYLSARLIEEVARTTDGEGGDARLAAMRDAVWREEEDLPPAGLFVEGEESGEWEEGDLDSPIPFTVPGVRS